MGSKPEWLTCDVILGLLGGPKEQRQKNYRAYVENAVREGLAESPWEHLQENAVLGGKAFLEKLRKHVVGDAREQRGAVRLAKGRPTLKELIAAVEQIKGKGWRAFRDQHNDSGRDLVLYAGQRVCGLKLRDLAQAMGMTDYGAVSSAIRRFEKLLKHRKLERQQWKRLCQKYKNQI